MWFADAPASGSNGILLAIIGVVGVILAPAITGFFAWRGSARNLSADRVKQANDYLDEELDDVRAEVVALKQSNGILEATLADRERKLIRAAYLLMQHNIDPDLLNQMEGRHGATGI